MSNVYDQNAPTDFPGTQAQPEIFAENPERKNGPMALPQIKETVERWKKEILDKIQYLKETLDQAQKDKEALLLETDQLKGELAAARTRAQQLEGDLAGVMELYNRLVQEVQGALQE